jgi:DNA-binding NarL/FixJ family response regulator
MLKTNAKQGQDQSIRVVTVVAKGIFQAGLISLLKDLKGLSIVGEASTGAEALQLAEKTLPELALVEPILSDMSGVDLSRELCDTYPEIKIILFSDRVDRKKVDAAFKVGVCAVVSRISDPGVISEAISSVWKGTPYLSPDINAELLTSYRLSLFKHARASKPVLSSQDKQLLQFIADGQRNKEIATHLGLGIKSVEAARSRLMKKLHCSSSIEMVRYAVREGIAT